MGTLRGRLERARERLRGRLARRGLTLSAGVLTALLTRQAPAAVPTVLLESTARLAGLVAGGGAATAGVVSAEVNALARGVLPVVRVNDMKAMALWLVVGFLCSGTGVAVYRAPADGPTTPEKTPAAAAAALSEPKPRTQAPGRAQRETAPLTVRGTATDPAGKPVRGATVKLIALDWSGPSVVIGTDTTDEQGRYTIAKSKLPFDRPRDNPPQGRFQVCGTAPGYGFTWHGTQIHFPTTPRPPKQPDQSGLVFQGEAAVMDLTFEPAASLRGRVVGEAFRIMKPLRGLKSTSTFAVHCGSRRMPDEYPAPTISWASMSFRTRCGRPRRTRTADSTWTACPGKPALPSRWVIPTTRTFTYMRRPRTGRCPRRS